MSKIDSVYILSENRENVDYLIFELLYREDTDVVYFRDIDRVQTFTCTKAPEYNCWVIIDYDTNQDVVTFVKELKEDFPKLKIIVLSDIIDEEIIAKCFHYGVCDYIIKNKDPDVIVDQVLGLLNNNTYETPEYIEVFEVKDVINQYKIKEISGEQIILETPQEIPTHGLISIPDKDGHDVLYRVQDCRPTDNGALVTCWHFNNLSTPINKKTG
jgi:DNA-binding NarL/FixJ family response regulator